MVDRYPNANQNWADSKRNLYGYVLNSFLQGEIPTANLVTEKAIKLYNINVKILEINHILRITLKIYDD